MYRLDEKSLRNPEFEEGFWLTLADGQRWAIPKPVYRIYPRFADDGSVSLASKYTFGEEIDYFLDLVDDPADAVGDITRRMEFMGRLLRHNYSLSNDDLGRLLSMNRKDPDSNEMWNAIDLVLIGESPEGEPLPKPSADGCA